MSDSSVSVRSGGFLPCQSGQRQSKKEQHEKLMVKSSIKVGCVFDVVILQKKS